jgi:hypothetical protein
MHVKSTYSDRKILHLLCLKFSYGVLGRLFFLNWPGSSKFKTQMFGCGGKPPVLTLHGRCCLNNSFHWSALRSFYVHKGILFKFYFHIISLTCTVFKLDCPAHLFPNTPRTLRSFELTTFRMGVADQVASKADASLRRPIYNVQRPNSWT